MYRYYFITLLLFLFSSCERTEDINNNILRLYGDALEDIGYSIAPADNGFVIAGQLTDVSRPTTKYIDGKTSVKKMGIIKTDKNGNVLWQKSFGNKLPAVGTRAIVLDDGSVVCVGYVMDTITPFLKDIFIVKTDNQGGVSLQRIYKTTGDVYNQYATDIIKTTEGFMVLGSTDAERQPITDSTGNEAGKKDILIMRINNNLDIISTWTTGFPGNDEGVALKNDFNGAYIIAATTDRSDKPKTDQDGNNILLLKVNAEGKDTQQRIIGKTGNEYAADIEVLNDGYLIAGTYGNEGPDQRGYVWRLSGNIFAPPLTDHKIEIESVASTATFRINAVSRYKSSSFVMAGQSGSGSSARMIIFITDNEGNLISGKSVITGGTGSQSVNDVISDDTGNIFAVGKNSYETNSMISLLKFRF